MLAVSEDQNWEAYNPQKSLSSHCLREGDGPGVVMHDAKADWCRSVRASCLIQQQDKRKRQDPWSKLPS